ncbi:MAG: flagellar assembly protein FliX [Rhodospirillales bacterium]|nr:flagellar assembly protein FliX [Rhodospirillales bacterium]MCW8861712.1 flagellar assembly protein FliX [Rhodospirillales bacterium]MCW8951149.1 flagellar assembly protein FliX [Rhodospirillales bacterium]MCW8969991.1 flagellar assembly protein FliX [Rhodospirillales bacterium]MCW9001881.1 flagellar assembly protein FliX [Rhodospirillales bacterium]
MIKSGSCGSDEPFPFVVEWRSNRDDLRRGELHCDWLLCEMKITDVKSARPASSAKAKGAKGGGGADFARHLSEAAGGDGPEQASGSVPVAGVGPVFAAQDAGDSLEREARKRLMDRGEDILEYLERIRLDILAGALSKHQLMNLAQLLRSRRQAVDDPGLIDIIDEIELRAQVEIAKWTRTTG